MNHIASRIVRRADACEFTEVVNQPLPHIAVAEVFDLSLKVLVSIQQMLRNEPPGVRTSLTKPVEDVGGDGVRDAGLEDASRACEYTVTGNSLLSEDVTCGNNRDEDL